MGHSTLADDGRIGPPTTIIDVKPELNNCHISTDKLTIQSHSPFLTLKANCCIFKGKWMYEVCEISGGRDCLLFRSGFIVFLCKVQLRSKGVMQIGWCSPKCKFTQDTGVGDTLHSYGLDGSKQRIWHVHTRK